MWERETAKFLVAGGLWQGRCIRTHSLNVGSFIACVPITSFSPRGGVVRTELLVVEALLSQANTRARTEDWDGVDEMLLHAAAVLDRVLTLPIAPTLAQLPAPPAAVVEVREPVPRAMAAAA